MSYLNQVIRRTAPMTPAQCAMYALLGSEWVGVKWIFDAGPLYLESEIAGVSTSSSTFDRTVSHLVKLGVLRIPAKGMLEAGPSLFLKEGA